MQANNILSKIGKFNITGNGLYIISFLTYYFFSFMKLTTYTAFVSPSWITRISYLIVLFLLLKIYFFDKLSIGWFIGNSCLILLGVVVWRKTRQVDILMYILLVLGAKHIDFRAVINWFFKVGLIMFIFIIISSQIGVIKDLVYIRHGVARHALGINYPTDFGAHTFYLILAYAYLHFRKLNWKNYGCFIILGFAVLVITEARLDFIAILLLIPIFMIAQRAYRGRHFYQNIASFYWMLPAILAYVVMISVYFYHSSNHLFQRLDRLFSNRLNLSSIALQRYHVKLFGNYVLEHGYGGESGHQLFNSTGTGMKYFFIDSSYVRLFVIYGLIIALLVIAAMTVIALRSILMKDYCLAAVILMISISCIIEQHLLNIAFNPFLIALLANGAFYVKNSKVLRSSR